MIVGKCHRLRLMLVFGAGGIVSNVSSMTDFVMKVCKREVFVEDFIRFQYFSVFLLKSVLRFFVQLESLYIRFESFSFSRFVIGLVVRIIEIILVGCNNNPMV